MNKIAFTLAEVIITITIVAIVATMTISSIVAANQKTELEVRFVKSYKTIIYAVNMAVAQNGPIETWDWKDRVTVKERNDFIKEYFLSYLNVAKFCPDSSVKGCFPDVIYKLLNGSKWKKITNSSGQVLLADGTSVDFSLYSACASVDKLKKCLIFRIDTNGPKKPNVVGLDYHEFIFYPASGEFLPHGINIESSYDEKTNRFEKNTLEKIQANCNKNGGPGWFCSARIIQDGFKMNYY